MPCQSFQRLSFYWGYPPVTVFMNFNNKDWENTAPWEDKNTTLSGCQIKMVYLSYAPEKCFMKAVFRVKQNKTKKQK